MSSSFVTVLNSDVAADSQRIRQLLADPTVEVLDTWQSQADALTELRPSPAAELLQEPTRWVYYPWRRTVVRLLGPRSYHRLRLDRNRNLVTMAEQELLGRLHIGIVGLSSGHVIAHSLAMAGFCGKLRLADLDAVGISNLNRVPATVFDLGINKATVAMRRIAELDPYLPVEPITSGLSAESIEGFLDNLDLVIEQCDSLEMKLLLREHARARGIPVMMATSDRGLVDIERFDKEPTRPLFHGMLGGISTDTLRGLSTSEKLPYVLQILDSQRLSAKMGASLLEVDHTLSAWPQLAGEVIVGAAAVLEAVRRLGLGEPLPSGRTQIDVSDILRQLSTPPSEVATAPTPETASETPITGLGGRIDAIVAATIRAPSGGNSQPWRIDTMTDKITVAIDPTRTSAMDVSFRGSATAVGAATFNARVAAAANRFATTVTYTEHSEGAPLRAVIRLTPGADHNLARWYPGVQRRETNRHRGTGAPFPSGLSETLCRLANEHGARLQLSVDPAEIERAGAIFAAADRIRYLTAHLHREMFSELRWPGDNDQDFGIDIRSLELDVGTMAALSLLRRGDVLATVDSWESGAILGEDTYKRTVSSAALATVLVDGQHLTDFARGGGAMAAVWTAAQEAGLALQPVSPPFLYAHNTSELRELSGKHAAELERLREEFSALVGQQPAESLVLTLRISVAPDTSVRSRRSLILPNRKG